MPEPPSISRVTSHEQEPWEETTALGGTPSQAAGREDAEPWRSAWASPSQHGEAKDHAQGTRALMMVARAVTSLVKGWEA